MNYRKSSLRLVLLLLAAMITLSAATAQTGVNISGLSYLDRRYMQEQRERVEDLVSRNFGSRISGGRDQDLRLLQSLLDRQLVRPDQTLELQAMGVVMGDLLAADLGMHWVVYEDRAGRSRALRYRETENYLFPITMISRRREAGNETTVVQIYEKAYGLIAPLRTPLPFQ